MSGDPGGFAEQKLKSFSIGMMGGNKRSLSRREMEDAKKKQEKDEVGKVYQEFVSSFDDQGSNKMSKTWVKAGTFNAGNRKEDTTDKGQLYKPTSKFMQEKEVKSEHKMTPTSQAKRPEKLGSKKKEKEKKKSNLEMFKEELKAMQEEREERHRIKGTIKGGSSGSSQARDSYDDGDRGRKGAFDAGSHDNGDPNTTNLYLGNLSPNLTEQKMLDLFGKFGPLASIKIMWPRTEDERSRGKNCGFVAYMSRKDGERALHALAGKDIDGFEMRMGWGKPVPIPLHPIYVPPSLHKYTLPPSSSGLPFNAQTTNKEEVERWKIGQTENIPTPTDEDEKEKFNKMLHETEVKVVIPTDRTQLCLINRMIEFVIREGPMFEAMVMNREMSNRSFAFLFENKSSDHIYYRWRLYSLLQGDSKDSWSTENFRMFRGGPLWKPPPMNLYTAGMPDELVKEEISNNERHSDERDRDRDRPRRGRESRRDGDDRKSSRSRLSERQRDKFEEMLRNLYPDRNPVAETMVWCIEHAEAGPEIVECITESLSILQTPIAKKVARLYLISDILHNCSVKGVTNVSYYRKGFQAKLPEIFGDLRDYHKKIESRMKAESFKQRVMNCFRAWEDWALYPQVELIRFQNIFLGLVEDTNNGDSDSGRKDDDDELDGKSLSEDDDDVDGIPLDGAALLKSAGKKGGSIGSRPSAQQQHSDDSDVDGMPMTTGEKQEKRMPAGFVPSKWETIDPEDVQAQAVTSKWDLFEQGGEQERGKKGITEPDDEDEDDIDGVPLQDDNQIDVRLSEDRRAKLREIEIKVMRYQDELESGKEAVRPGWTISEQIDQYRKKLLKSSSNSASNYDTPDTPVGGSRVRTPLQESDDEDGSSSRRSRNRKKSKRSHRTRSSSSSRSRSRERKSKRRRRSRSHSSSSDERGRSRKRRSRSRSPSSSSKKHKKKSKH